MANATPTRRKRKADEKARARKVAEVARAEYDRLKAIADEALAEEQAPAAQRGLGVTAASRKSARDAGLDKPVPVSIRDANAEPDPKRGGYRRINPLYAMNRRGNGRTVTHDHLKAAERFRNDYETGILRGSSPKSGLGTTVVAGIGQDVEFLWLAAAERYRNAIAAVPRSLRGVVEAIAIVGQTVPWIARAITQSEETTVGLVVAGLDSLADHYDPQRVTRARAIEKALAGLKPLGFDFAVSAIGEVIPQERIGRGRTSASA
jgi:uncharacterized protein DUF6456